MSDDSKPAFPYEFDRGHSDEDMTGHEGMTLRDYFSAHSGEEALDIWVTLYGNEPVPDEDQFIQEIARIKGEIADAMLFERERGGE